MRRSTILFLGLLLALLIGFAVKDRLLALPPVAAEAAPGAFDANRAFARLERILEGERPHPVDSDSGDLVRGRIVAELRAAGLEPRVTDQMTCNNFERSRSVNCQRVRNIVATIGPAQGRHVLFVSHYDSVTAGPGASDDGMGVATMIEVAALLRDQGLGRPVTFLFNEGEETGLAGARAFLDNDPVAGQVDTLVNLEARGVEGPAIMFETSRPNGAAIEAFREAVSRPVANSLSTDFYRLIPNSTDVTVFAERPWTILNFAVIGDETRYHTAGDDLASLDRRSLQHMGDQALALARHLAAGPLPAHEGNLVYADLFGRTLIALPLLVALVTLGVLLLLFAGAAWMRGGFGRALLIALGGIAGATSIAFAALYLIALIRPGDFWRAYPLATFMAIYASTLLACSWALLRFGGRLDRDQLRFACWFVVVACGAVVCLVAPGAAIYFLVPPLIVLAGALLERRIRGAERAFGILAALLLFLSFAQVLHLIELLLIDGPYWLLAPVAALAVLPLLVEAMPLEPDARTSIVPFSLAGLAAAGWIAAILLPQGSPDRQQLFTIEYLRDVDRGEGRWGVSNKRAVLPEAFQRLGDWALDDPIYSTRQRWFASAPDLAGVDAPSITLVAAQQEPRARRLTFRISMNGSESVTIRAPADAPVQRAGVPGALKTFGRGPVTSPYQLRCYGRSCDGLTMEMVVGAADPVELTLIGTRTGLPPEAQPLIAARPENSRPQYTPDATYTVRRVRL
jgi:hypothetical protein